MVYRPSSDIDGQLIKNSFQTGPLPQIPSTPLSSPFLAQLGFLGRLRKELHRHVRSWMQYDPYDFLTYGLIRLKELFF
ncbi:hypothetical protein Y032_0022g570 [Ancylostoma ceylanicum]|nr:hypothetical protein Y032_0022g570 [Ancylostoma ceylanicum]